MAITEEEEEEEEARDNCPGKGYLNFGHGMDFTMYQDSFPYSRNPDDKLPGNQPFNDS